MRSFFTFIFLSLGVLFINAQSFPYLNASTGNDNEFPVDKDTNIFMFHGNRLVKTDKNFNPIWANTYSGVVFNNLVLSKTGSIYFVGNGSSSSPCFGKINANGSLAWAKSTISVTTGTTTTAYQPTVNRVFLDRNNNLLVTGALNNNYLFILKLDTNGNSIKFKCFSTGYSPSNNMMTIVNDSAGYYKLINTNVPTVGPYIDVRLYTYNDNTDQFTDSLNLVGFTPYGFGLKLVKSKFSNNFYLLTEWQDTYSFNYASIYKLNAQGKFKWNTTISRLNNTNYSVAQDLEEGSPNELLFTMFNPFMYPSFTTAYLRLDSNGVSTSTLGIAALLNNIFYGPQLPQHAARSIYPGNYYFDLVWNSFPVNPLTIQKFTSSLTYSCAATTSYSLVNAVGGPSSSFVPGGLGKVPVVSYTVSPTTPVVTPVSFSVIDYCTALGVSEMSAENGVKISPNPTHDKLNITIKNGSIQSFALFDVNGRVMVSTESNNGLIDVSGLPSGLYFLKIKTDKGELNRKFVKE